MSIRLNRSLEHLSELSKQYMETEGTTPASAIELLVQIEIARALWSIREELGDIYDQLTEKV